MMSEMPLVSIVIPCYNCRPFIEACLASLTTQGYARIEVLMVDDHSTDGTYERLAALATADSRIRVLRHEQKGANRARQWGVTHATGDYILFSDADDSWEPGSLQALVHRAQADSSDIVVGNLNLVALETGLTRPCYISLPALAGAVNMWAQPEYILAINPNAVGKLFRAEVVKPLTLSDVRFTQDWNITYQAVANSRTVSFLDIGVYNYIRRKESITTSRSNFHIDPLLVSLQSFADVVTYLRTKNPPRPVAAAFGYLYLKFMFTFLIKGLDLSPGEQRRFHREVRRRFRAGTPGWGTRMGYARREMPKGMLMLLGVSSLTAYRRLFPFIKRKISIDR